jgi:hypothetical protein
VVVYVARPGHDLAQRLLCLFGEPHRISGEVVRIRSRRFGSLKSLVVVATWAAALGLTIWFARAGLHWSWSASLKLCIATNVVAAAISRNHYGIAKLYNRFLWWRCEHRGHIIRVPEAFIGPFRKQTEALGMTVALGWAPCAPRCLSTILNPFFDDIAAIMPTARRLESRSGLSTTAQHNLRRSLAQTAAAVAIREVEQYRAEQAYLGQLTAAFQAGYGLTSGPSA